jgi:hypothetical protein
MDIVAHGTNLIFSIIEPARRWTRGSTLALALSLIFFLGNLAPQAASAGEMPRLFEEGWITNGRVYAAVKSGQTAYIGGDFDFVGPNTCHGVPLDLATGRIDNMFPRLDNNVNVATPDGKGGWFVGGRFETCGMVNQPHLAHITPGGWIDWSWHPVFDGEVRALAYSAGILYVGGNFSNVNGQPRGYLAAVNASTGELTD